MNKSIKFKYYLAGICIIFALILVLFLSFSYCQQKEEEFQRVTEGEFAVRLVKLMGIERRLPPAPLRADYIEVLESIGIAPLKGWHEDKILTRENYAVIMALAAGKEKLVWDKAQEVCDRNVEAINSRWELKRKLDRRPNVTLEELIKDKTYFPEGPPMCPYCKPYKDKDGKVEKHNHKSIKEQFTWW